MKLMKTIKELKNYIILILVGVISYWALNHLGLFIDILKTIITVLSPFLLGGAIAFVLNIPTTKIEHYLIKKSKKKKTNGLFRGISIVISLCIFLLAIAFISFMLIPELIESIESLLSNIPVIVSNIETFIIDLLDKYPDIQIEIEKIFNTSGNATTIISNILNYIINGVVSFITSLVSSFVTIFTALIFSIYMLAQKESLLSGTKKLVYAIFNKEDADKVVEVGSLTNKIFNSFISGQCTEAVILGLIMFVSFTIFRFPYALIIAILTGVTSLIPMFGALIAMIIGAALIAITSPIQAIIFIVVFQVIQQIEGNFIYPKVVGKSVGLSPLLTLLAITVGGNLFGIPGMLIGLPTTSVIYTLVKQYVNEKFDKNSKESK